MRREFIVGAVVLAAGATAALADTLYEKSPDLGDFWFPLDPDSGSFVYANSFVAPAGDTTISDLGMWLNAQGTGGSSIRFEVWGDTGGSGPDAGNVISSTGSLAAFANSGLTYYEASASSGNLVPGNTYWFAATVVGESGPGFYNVGGHTQNSQHSDNGTFWFSNDPSGSFFDGQNFTPEMAFTVRLVPAPASMALLGLGGLVAARRRR
ncbi:MAG TPA: PEP-CTERM sorting domain-containing protein [Phycisphaerales bacterium]|nr:PEP-CTERM sorting domain-containing protein [Phycisphaerales bacterium]